MTIEELTAALEKAQESISKLETKNSELVSREKAAKAKATEAEEAAEVAAAAAAEKAGDVEAIKASLTKKHEAEIAKLRDGNNALTAQLHTLLVDNIATAEVAKHGVPAYQQRALVRDLKEGVEVRDGAAFVGDVPFEKHLTSFFASDEGKAWLPAPQHSGGAAPGSSTTATATPTEWNLTSYMNLKRDDPAAASRYAKEHNQPFG